MAGLGGACDRDDGVVVVTDQPCQSHLSQGCLMVGGDLANRIDQRRRPIKPVGRATLYRHFPTRESLIGGVQEAGTDELVAAFGSADLDKLPVDRAIARATGVFLRTGAKYAAVI